MIDGSVPRSYNLYKVEVQQSVEAAVVQYGASRRGRFSIGFSYVLLTQPQKQFSFRTEIVECQIDRTS